MENFSGPPKILWVDNEQWFSYNRLSKLIRGRGIHQGWHISVCWVWQPPWISFKIKERLVKIDVISGSDGTCDGREKKIDGVKSVRLSELSP